MAEFLKRNIRELLIENEGELVKTVTHFRDIPEFIGPDFVAIGITLEDEIFVDNCIVGKEDWKPRVGDEVLFTLEEEFGNFPIVTPTEEA